MTQCWRQPCSAPTAAFEDDSEQWLLIKKRDAAAVAGWDAEDHPQSVKTGRTNDEVKENRDAVGGMMCLAFGFGVAVSATFAFGFRVAP